MTPKKLATLVLAGAVTVVALYVALSALLAILLTA